MAGGATLAIPGSFTVPFLAQGSRCLYVCQSKGIGYTGHGLYDEGYMLVQVNAEFGCSLDEVVDLYVGRLS